MEIYPAIPELNKKQKFQQKQSSRQKIVDKVIEECNSRPLLKRIESMSQCGNYLLFEECLNNPGHLSHLRFGSFCQIRGCPVCEWLRAQGNYIKSSNVIDDILTNREDVRFMMMLLTVPNCAGQNFKHTIEVMNPALVRMFGRKIFDDNILGYIKVIEVDRNKNRPDSLRFHPHFHILLAVPKSFTGWSDDTIKKHWKDCIDKEYHKNPFEIDELKYCRSCDPFDFGEHGPYVGTRQCPMTDVDGKSRTISEIVYACAKYVSTPSDEKIDEKIRKGDNSKDPIWEWSSRDIEYYLNGLSHLRLISSGGILKMSKLDEMDAIGEEVEEKVCPVCSAPVGIVEYELQRKNNFFEYIKKRVISLAEYRDYIRQIIESKKQGERLREYKQNQIDRIKSIEDNFKIEQKKYFDEQERIISLIRDEVRALYKIASNFADVVGF